MNCKQKLIKVERVKLPVIKYDGIEYYPLTYTFEKVLLKNKQSVKLLKENGYNDELKQFKVDFSFKDGGMHNTYCISREGLIDLLGKSNVGGLTVEQKQGMNFLLEHFNLDLIDEEPRFLEAVNYKNDNTYGEFEKDCIKETLKLDNDLIWQRCKDCGKYYPLHSNFFASTNRGKNFYTLCKNCLMNDGIQHFKHPKYDAKTIGEIESIKMIKSHIPSFNKNYDVIGIYEDYLYSDRVHFPEKIRNKDDYILILKYLHDTGKIDKDELSNEYLIRVYKLKGISSYIKIKDIYKLLYNNIPEDYPWRFKAYKYNSPRDMETALIVFDNYLKDKDIAIDDIYGFNYKMHIKNARLGKKYYNGDILDFVMKFYDNKYPAYKFKIISTNYWKDKENRIRALKYLIEEDMKLEIRKIPLYLTITSIRNVGTTTMYTVLKNYYSNLYEWINEIYPDVFDPKDFDVNYMRNEFDSIDEHTIDEILRDSFDNVLYNPKHNEHTIKLLGKIPDWFIFTTKGVIIVEYFGLWNKERGMYNSRTRDYIERSKDKIEKYKALQGYKFLYIYPEDLHNNYEGLCNKINDIKK